MEKYCCEYELEEMFPNIKEYDYIKPIEELTKYYKKSLYFKNLLKEAKKNKNKKILPQNDINDEIITEYIKCRKNCSILTFWDKAEMTNNSKKEMINLLEKNGNIYYIKEIELSYYGGLGLLYQLYSTTPRMKEYTQIVYKANRIGFEKNKTSKLLIIVYEHKNKKDKISGSTASFKSKIRNIWLREDIKKTKYNEKQDEYPREYDYLHINDYFYEAVEYAQIYFNRNSLSFLNEQILSRLMKKYMDKSFKYFNLLKKLIIENFKPVDYIRFLPMSSIVLYTYGLRNMNDIDVVMTEYPKISDKQIKLLRQYDFLDISIPNTPEYTKEWKNELERRAKLWNEKTYEDIILNPEHYYYFMGIKIISIEHDVQRRIERKRPASYADIIAINIFMKKNIPLRIPDFYTEYNEDIKDDITIKVDKEKYLDTIKYYLEKRYNLYNVNITKYIKIN